MQNSIYSVSQVNKYIKNMFLSDYMLTNLSVKGELSNVKYHSSGHIYFTLKDEKGAIKGVMFASMRQGLKFVLTEGMQVIVNGSCEVYERDGTYQIYAREIRQDGIGNLYEEFEKLKARLEEQGMFDPMFKRPIPKFVKTLGVVTASTGAAVRDIINVSKRRNPGIQIILYPAIVQGEEAPLSIVSGIKALEKLGVDCIIVGRGGGSMEDLWGFNDERVAQAIFDCSIPIISAVGHETDFTIADFVADLRAATPSAAAELAVCDMLSILSSLNDIRDRLKRDMDHVLMDKKRTNAHLSERLMLLNPRTRVLENRKHIELIKASLERDMKAVLVNVRHRLMLDAGRLEGLSPVAKLSSGFSYVSLEDGRNVKSIDTVEAGDNITIHVTDGKIKARVTDKEDMKWQKTNN